MIEPPLLDSWLERAAAAAGTPCYVYFTDPVLARIQQLREAFGRRFELSFAAKSNPNPALLGWLSRHVDNIDVSSIGELRLAREGGWDPARASFTGPGKREFEISEAIAAGVGELVIESVAEAKMAAAIARRLGRVQDVLLRIAPAELPKGFGQQMAGRPSPFGLDVEVMHREIPVVLALPDLRVVGLHIYSGSQCLRPEPICDNYRIFLSIFQEVCDAYDLRPRKLVMGSGLGIPYHTSDRALDLDATAAGIVGALDAFRAMPRFAETRLVLELGRYLVGEAGYFLTRVISVKESRGVRIAICDGGMHNHLPASGHFGMVIQRNYMLHKVGVPREAPGEAIDIVGPLCTSMDRLASGAVLPRVEAGDLIALHNSGAYGLTASPLLFISHAPAREVLVEGDRLRDVTRVTTIDTALAG